jgi:hypothetical protein
MIITLTEWHCMPYAANLFRAGFRGAHGARAPGLPPEGGLPPETEKFSFTFYLYSEAKEKISMEIAG